MTSATQVPKLRFPGFSGEWQAKELSDVTKWSSGGTPAKDNPKYWGGGIPWISAASMYGSTFSSSERTLTELGVRSGTKVAKQGSLLLLVRGSMLFNTIPVGIAGRDVAFNQDVKAITSDVLDSEYLLYFFQASEHKLLSKVVGTGIGAGKLDMDDMYGLPIAVPSHDEQGKIAAFLTAVDDRIGLSERKLELLKKYKQGVIQQIFTQRIRFKDSNGKSYTKWEEKELGDIGETYNGLSGKAAGDFGSGRPYITYMQIFESSSIDSDNFSCVQIKAGEKQSRVKKGDIFFTTSSETPEEVGFASVLLNEVGELYLNSFCFGYRLRNQQNLLPGFAQFLFRSGVFRQKVMRLAQGSTRYNLSKAELMKATVALPPIEEQQKIADFLTALDDKIKLEESKLEQARNFKESLLQQMFV